MVNPQSEHLLLEGYHRSIPISVLPLDCYGFDVNWYGTLSSAAEIIKNPPLAAYYLALAGSLFGMHEVSLHAAFLLPALAAVAGSYLLARELSPHPLAATLAALFTPVFIVSSATVMCDTMMLAWYVWAVYFWLRGVRRDCLGDLVCASLLTALCCLTKYFGVSLIPLLLVYALGKKGWHRERTLLLLVPVLVLCWYQWATGMLYGRGLLLDAAAYAGSQKAHGARDTLSSLITGLSFAGGLLAPALLLVPRLWGKRVGAALLAGVALLALALSRLPVPDRPEGAPWGYYLQLSLFAVAGLHLLALALRDLLQHRDPEALLLFLWLNGTFVFATLVNWTVNGRSMLPMVPAAGMLLARALERGNPGRQEGALLRSWGVAVPLAGALLLSMLVAWSDSSLAGTTRDAAREIVKGYGGRGMPLTFQGHWGFQYYMEQGGALALDGKRPNRTPYLMVMPENNINLGPELLARGVPLQTLGFPALPFLTDMNANLGAGFYSSAFGALPFEFGALPDEAYAVALFK